MINEIFIFSVLNVAPKDATKCILYRTIVNSCGQNTNEICSVWYMYVHLHVLSVSVSMHISKCRSMWICRYASMHAFFCMYVCYWKARYTHFRRIPNLGILDVHFARFWVQTDCLLSICNAPHFHATKNYNSSLYIFAYSLIFDGWQHFVFEICFSDFCAVVKFLKTVLNCLNWGHVENIKFRGYLLLLSIH